MSARGRIGAAFGLMASILSLGGYSLDRPAGSVAAAEDVPPVESPSASVGPEQPTPPSAPSMSASPTDTGAVPKASRAVKPTPSPTTRPVAPSPSVKAEPAVSRPSTSPLSRPSTATPSPKPTQSPSAAAASSPLTVGSKAAQVAAYVRAQVGRPYVYGGVGPASFDCSGLAQTAFARVGVALPRTSQSQSTRGVRVSLDQLLPGDLLFWGAPGAAYHEAVYVGGGLYVAAENPRVGVVVQSIAYYRPDFARRVL